MKVKMLLEKSRAFALAVVGALMLWQAFVSVQAQKSAKPKTAHPAAATKTAKTTDKAGATPNNAEYTAKIKEYTSFVWISHIHEWQI